MDLYKGIPQQSIQKIYFPCFGRWHVLILSLLSKSEIRQDNIDVKIMREGTNLSWKFSQCIRYTDKGSVYICVFFYVRCLIYLVIFNQRCLKNNFITHSNLNYPKRPSYDVISKNSNILRRGYRYVAFWK